MIDPDLLRSLPKDDEAFDWDAIDAKAERLDRPGWRKMGFYCRFCLVKAMKAEAQHRYQDALDWLHDAVAAYSGLRLLEKHGVTSRGKHTTRRKKGGPAEAEAVAWGIAKGKRLNRRDPYRLALEAMGSIDLEPKDGDEFFKMRDRIGPKIKAGLAG